MIRPSLQPYRKPRTLEDLPFGATFRCGHLVEANSGWRTFRPVVDQEKCTGCLRCYLVCPDGVVSQEGKEMVIDYDFCKGCGICAQECKFGAIAMQKEEK